MSAAREYSVQMETLSDEAILTRIRGGERALFELLMRRHNRRVFRIARAVVRTDDEAEDVMQEAYVRAYAHLDQFAGGSSWITWVTRIALHEALARVRRQGRFTSAGEDLDMSTGHELRAVTAAPDEETRLLNRDLIRVLESSVDALPEAFRTVFMLREVEGLDTEEVAACLAIPAATVKTRLFRAREHLRQSIAERIEAGSPDAFSFHLSRCDRVVAAVMNRLR